MVFIDIDELILKHKKRERAKNNQKDIEKEQIFKLSHFKICYRDIVIKTVRYQNKVYRSPEKWPRTESSKISPYISGQLLFNKGTRQLNEGKTSLFKKWYWNNSILICKKHLRPLPHNIYKN